MPLPLRRTGTVLNKCIFSSPLPPPSLSFSLLSSCELLPAEIISVKFRQPLVELTDFGIAKEILFLWALPPQGPLES